MTTTTIDTDHDLVSRLKLVQIEAHAIESELGQVEARRMELRRELRAREAMLRSLLGELAEPTPMPLFEGEGGQADDAKPEAGDAGADLVPQGGGGGDAPPRPGRDGAGVSKRARAAKRAGDGPGSEGGHSGGEPARAPVGPQDLAGIAPGWRGKGLTELPGVDSWFGEGEEDRAIAWVESIRVAMGLPDDIEPTLGHLADAARGDWDRLDRVVPKGHDGVLMKLNDVIEHYRERDPEFDAACSSAVPAGQPHGTVGHMVGMTVNTVDPDLVDRPLSEADRGMVTAASFCGHCEGDPVKADAIKADRKAKKAKAEKAAKVAKAQTVVREALEAGDRKARIQVERTTRGEKGPVPWREFDLAVAVGTMLADELWRAGEMETLGDVADFLADGADLAELPDLEPTEVAAIREKLVKFREDQGWGPGSGGGFPLEWITRPAYGPAHDTALLAAIQADDRGHHWRWTELVRDGASDNTIGMNLLLSFGESKATESRYVPVGDSIAITVTTQGGDSPAVWFGWEPGIDDGPEPAPDLEGQALVDAVRRVLAIPRKEVTQ
jgi:hypothetical protein